MNEILNINAKDMLDILLLDRLYLVDPYKSYEGIDEEYDWKLEKRTATDLLMEHPAVRFVFKASSEAVNEIPDNLDFVYLDANHDYEYVKQDIKDYYKKVREGGLLGGHDYHTSPGVNQAVNEFGLPVNHRPNGDWWLV